MMEGPVRLLLVDDDEVILRSYVTLLDTRTEIEVVAAVGSAGAALKSLSTRFVDVALVDVEMPGTDGIRLAHEIIKSSPNTRVVMMTAFESPRRIGQALDEGVQGYLTKDMDFDQIVMGVQQAAAGAVVLGPGPAAHVIAQRHARRGGYHETHELTRTLASLPDRYQRLLPLIAEGKSNREIAAALSYTEGSVRTYMSEILRTTGCRSRTELALKLAMRTDDSWPVS
ncbi:response regulator transcription factor [Actinomyces radicidentis]|uniref:response regulator transcription factor n=1 Tax=Actinomyces radicidentis TaxID=111015 RepID=UPI0028F06B44|nr:response regulator transcription factor [Actinomyces radicidentis]